MYAKFKCMSFATILFKKNIIKNSSWCYLDMENLKNIFIKILQKMQKKCLKNKITKILTDHNQWRAFSYRFKKR